MTMTTSEPNPNPFRIATWNMDHWKRNEEQRTQAWSALHDLKCDVVLAQEVVPPKSLRRDAVVYRPIGESRSWGSAVVALREGIEVREIDAVRSREGRMLFSMLGTHPGAVIVARAEVPGFGPLTLVSVYGLINTYAQTTMLRVVADLIPLFDSPEGEHVILGGDFNVTTAAQKDSQYFDRYEAILRAVESLGLTPLPTSAAERPPRNADCPCKRPDCTHLPTYHASQLDYLYATKALASRCRKIELPHEQTRQLSDHTPILAELDLGKRPERTRWDPESFVELIAQRHGPAAGAVVADLITWARRRTEELRISAHRDARLDRLPISDSAEPELWFQLDRGHERPWQWTCSVRADGKVEIPFQRYRQRFASEEARAQVWERLNGIPGIGLERNLRGRPTFQIGALTDPETLRRFVGVLDFVVNESLGAGA